MPRQSAKVASAVLTIITGDGLLGGERRQREDRTTSIGKLDCERLPVLIIRTGDRERLSEPDWMIIGGDHDRREMALQTAAAPQIWATWSGSR